MTQEEIILKYLQEGRSITPLEAWSLCNCWALSSRISDLKKKGYKIKSEPVHDKNTNKTYARYFIPMKEDLFVCPQPS